MGKTKQKRQGSFSSSHEAPKGLQNKPRMRRNVFEESASLGLGGFNYDLVATSSPFRFLFGNKHPLRSTIADGCFFTPSIGYTIGPRIGASLSSHTRVRACTLPLEVNGGSCQVLLVAILIQALRSTSSSLSPCRTIQTLHVSYEGLPFGCGRGLFVLRASVLFLLMLVSSVLICT